MKLLALALSMAIAFAGTPLQAEEPARRPAGASSAGMIVDEQLLTSAGVGYGDSRKATLAPELGVGYRQYERDVAGGGIGSTHSLQALAGWRLTLADTFYFSATAKLPLYTYERTTQTGELPQERQRYDILHPERSLITWSGELGARLGKNLDWRLYYEQPGAADASDGTGKDRIGGRLIMRFK